VRTGCARIRRSFSRVVWLGAAELAVIAAASAMGQASATAARPADAGVQAPAFEVASIKLNKSGSGSSHSDFDHGRFTATNVSVKSLLEYEAYGITGAQILGGPGWLNSEAFDISAKVDDATAEQMKTLDRDQRSQLHRQLFQQLLIDRFKLAVHWETKEFPVYALVVAKGGSKLTKSKDAAGSTSVSSGNGRMAQMTAKGVTMARLAQTLTQSSSRELGRIVIDETGMKGAYDLALQWMPDDRSAAMINGSNENSAAAGPSIFTALQEQLGLKLESTKGPVETLVIDHIEQPSEN
jgi:uncharacterized protein (TIGR03435 family)